MKSTKALDFEINLLPVISILAVCISFLLLTAVWVRVGTFDLNQAFGTSTSADEAKKKPEVWVTFTNLGSVQVAVKNAPELNRRLLVNELRAVNSRPNVQSFAELMEEIKKQLPEVNMGLVIPAPETAYEDLIAIMDELKKQQVANIGIAPL